MRKKRIALLAVGAGCLMLSAGAVTADKLISAKITARVQSELPKASGIKASMPLLDVPRNLLTGSVKSANIKIANYNLKGSETDVSLAIRVKNISKTEPAIVGALEITATIPAATILKSAEFQNAEIIGKTLQISVGAGGFGKALLVPKFSNNQIFFQLQSVSVLGNPIPASSLPSDIQSQIKSKSIRELNVPKGLILKSVSLSPKGLLVNFRGTNIQLGKLGSSL